MTNEKSLLIANRIHDVGGKKVMFDFDLAVLYGTKTKVLRQAVKRNIDRFPEDFVFRLNKADFKELVTTCDQLSSTLKHNPYGVWAFTELGVAMLSSVLKTPEALKMNINIMRTFVLLRKLVIENDTIHERLNHLEIEYELRFESIEQALDFLIDQKAAEALQADRKRIGYKQ